MVDAKYIPALAPTRSRAPASTKRRELPRQEPIGRYDGSRERTWHPADGLARMPESANADTTTAAVIDPYGDCNERILATVNRRVDVLEQERSHQRISEAAYQTGRIIQAMFERLGRVSGTNWAGTSRRDPRVTQSETIARGIANAKEITSFLDRVRGQIGERNLRVLRRILGDRMTFEQCAGLEGKSGPRGQAWISETFRVALEDSVAAVQEAKGKVQLTPDDKHKSAAEAAQERQDAAIASGATLGRLEAELGELKTNRGRKGEIAELEVKVAGQRLRRATVRARRVG